MLIHSFGPEFPAIPALFSKAQRPEYTRTSKPNGFCCMSMQDDAELVKENDKLGSLGTSWDTVTSSLAVAIFDFRLPVSSFSVIDSTIEMYDPENMGLAVEIVFLSGLEAEVHWVSTGCKQP